MQAILWNIVLAIGIFLIPFNAHAYIDPGAGSSIIQVLIATAVGGLFGLKVLWQKFLSRAKKK
ncbi:MAG: hypothetical protein HY817_03130 [Candidatus Abawacabacteria bacterium]|nr:hypothetical protein [Candidatus Abawacabacteria bacterium]